MRVDVRVDVRVSLRVNVRLAVRSFLAMLLVLASLPGAVPGAYAQTLGPDPSTADPGVPGAPGSVISRLSQGSVALGETVSLTVIATDVQGELDTNVLEQVFDIVGRSRSSQVDVINGRRRDRASWVLELAPRRIGVFTVPPVTVGGVTSDLQTLEVTEAPSGGERPFFVEAQVDERSPWVQGQVILTLRVFQAIDFIDASLGEPRAEGLRVERLGEDVRRRDARDGREYEVTERRYALFAQRSGALRIEPIALDATVPVDPNRVRGFFTPSRRVLQRSEAIELQVRGRPPGSTGWWFPARDVSLAGEWSGGDDTLTVPAGSDAATRVGVPVTRTLSLRALGATPTMLPTIEPPEVAGASLYDEQPRIDEQTVPGGLLSEQRVAWAVVPTEPGSLALPETRIDWFDTVAGVTRTATLPATRLHVEPAPATSVTAPSATPLSSVAEERADIDDEVPAGAGGGQPLGVPATSSPAGSPVGAHWRWLALAAVLGWTLTGWAWWRDRRVSKARSGHRTATPPPDSSRALQRVRERESGRSSAELAEAVLSWARARWPQAAPGSLPALAQRLSGSPAAQTLLVLDAALYARQGDAGVPEGVDGLAGRLDAAAGSGVGTPVGPGDRAKGGCDGRTGVLPTL